LIALSHFKILFTPGNPSLSGLLLAYAPAILRLLARHRFFELALPSPRTKKGKNKMILPIAPTKIARIRLNPKQTKLMGLIRSSHR
jgi:hypothetical protein